MRLDGIDDIPWGSLQHAYGPADDVPVTLKALAAHGITAEKALNEIGGSLRCKGSVYKATAAAVPLLIDLLSDSALEDGGWLLWLLATMSSAHCFSEETQEPTENPVWEAVRAGVPRYLALLRASDKDIRANAARTLSYFPEHRAEILKELHQCIIWEQDQDIQAGLMLCQGRLEDTDAEQHQRLESAAQGDLSDPRTLTAAIALIRIDQENAAIEPVHVVQNVLTDMEGLPDKEYIFDVWDFGPGNKLPTIFLYLGPERAVSALTDLMEAQMKSDWGPDDEVVALLIETAFATQPGEQKRLSEAQRRILTILANADDVWDDQGGWNMSRNVQEYRTEIPQTRNALEAHLTESEAQ